MEKTSKFYITTAIAYVNGVAHIGHALEFIQADALARYYRLRGDDTYFLTGTDEHGVKIYETAKERGEDTQSFVDKNVEVFKSLEGLLNLSNDDFIRTSSQRHKRGAQKLWKKLVEAGDIYKGVYKGNYCVGCESFLPEKDLDEEGKCLIHKKKVQELEEKNYFFRLSKYSDQIKKLIEDDVLRVIPNSRKNEILNIIGDEGLVDVSFSRPKSVLPWGIPVPDDENQVMYVWSDALSNYITALGYEEGSDLFKEMWPADVHLIGKDILRFHAGIWIGMLLSAGLDIPKAIYVHGFVTSNGQKMSKSLGNVVDPLDYVSKYGADALRYFLLREIPTMDDGDFSHDRFLDVFNSELANGVGNLFNRVLMMVEKYNDGEVPTTNVDDEILGVVDEFVGSYRLAFEKFDLKKAIELTMEFVAFANKYIDDKKPWVMAKEGSDDLLSVLYNLLGMLRYLATALYPIIPASAIKMMEMLGFSEGDFAFDSNFSDIENSGGLARGALLFPRLEE